DVTGQVTLPAGTEMIMPGDNAAMDVELITPIAMEEKQRFAIREGGKTVGAGGVVSITEGRRRRQAPSRIAIGGLARPGPFMHLPSRGGPGGRRKRFRRSVAQWLEHRSPKPGVGGSSPSTPARHKVRRGQQSLKSAMGCARTPETAASRPY